MLRVKDILKAKGMLMKDFCELLGVTPQIVGKQLKGKVQLSTLERMAAALDIPLWQLFASAEDIKRDLGIEQEQEQEQASASQRQPAPAAIVCPHCGKQIDICVSVR